MWIPGLSTGGIGRRHFLKHLAGFSLMAAPSLSFVQNLAAQQNKLKKDSKSLIIHPGTTTHQQLTIEEQIATGVTPDYVRLSIGTEDVDDLIDDLRQGLEGC